MITDVLTDKTLHQIARKAGGKRVYLGIELDLDWADIDTLQCQHVDDVDLAFHILRVIFVDSFTKQPLYEYHTKVKIYLTAELCHKLCKKAVDIFQINAARKTSGHHS